jgi:hypothetical protein
MALGDSVRAGRRKVSSARAQGEPDVATYNVPIDPSLYTLHPTPYTLIF